MRALLDLIRNAFARSARHDSDGPACESGTPPGDGGEAGRDEGQLRERFWERLKLDELNEAEWEALCDGCGRCCLLKFEHEGSAQVHHTSVACRLLDPVACRCKHYEARTRIVPDCIVLSPETIHETSAWLPRTCAYRLRHEGLPLFDWHHLVSGDRESVHKAGISMRHRIVSESEINTDDIEKFVIEGL